MSAVGKRGSGITPSLGMLVVGWLRNNPSLGMLVVGKGGLPPPDYFAKEDSVGKPPFPTTSMPK